MKNEVMLIVWLVVFMAIADDQIKSAQSPHSHFCTARGFKELLDIRLLSDPVCFIGNGEAAEVHFETVETSDEHIPFDSTEIALTEIRQDSIIEIKEAEEKEVDIGDHDGIVVDQGIIKDVVSENDVAETTEPQSPGVNVQTGYPTVNPPETDQNLQPPSGRDISEREKPPDEVGAPSHSTDDMPSFDEWKRLRLQEEEEVRERTKQQGSGSASLTNGVSQTKAKPNRVNYASASCGAKVVGTNNEAQNAASILSENKDKYIIQPCKAKKWITLELCEPIQVTSIELGNLEFFSSQPESFVIFISDRLSNKDWTSLGTFHARDVRQIQSFPVTDEIYAKYIKIEMLSHYGSEHYCPLTVVRVFGTTVHEEDSEDSQDTDEGYTATDVEQEEETKDASLLKLAIDTAQSMLQDVIGKKEEPVEEKLTELKLNNETNITKPCPPEIKMDSTVNKTKGKPSLFPEVPSPTFTPSHPDVLIPPIVRLVKVPHGSLQELLTSCDFCEDRLPNACVMDRRSTCGYYRWMVYRYPTCCMEYFLQPGPKDVLDLHNIPHIETSTIAEEKKKSTLSIDLKPSTVIVESSAQEMSVKEHKISEAPKPNPTKVKDLDSTSTKTQPKHSVKQQNGKGNSKKEEARMSDIKPTKTQQKHKATQEVKLESSHMPIKNSQQTHTESLKVNTQTEKSSPKTEQPIESKTDKLEADPTASICEADMGDDEHEGCQMGPNVVGIRPSSTEEIILETETAPTSNKDTITPDQNTLPESSDQEKSEAVKGTHIYADENMPDVEDVDLPEHETDEEVQITKKPQLKETTLMKLRNRMKELELNLNLSSRYLEELSQRYKRQMEEMYTSLNRTIEKLTDTSKSAAERDKKQQQDIKELKTMVDMLNESLTDLSGRMHGLNQQVIERHLLLMLIQFVIFLLFLHWMLSRHPAAHQPQENSVKALSTLVQHPAKTTQPLKSAQPPQAKTSVETLRFSSGAKTPSPRRRRNSSDGTPARFNEKCSIVSARRSLDDLALESCENLIVEPNQSLFLPDMFSESPKQESDRQKSKKKKKCKHKLNSSDQGARRSFDSAANQVQEFKRKPKRTASEDFGMYGGLPNGFHDSTESLNETKLSRSRQDQVAGKSKHHMSWDFIHKSSSKLQHDNGSASSSASSVKSFRKK